ncbi:exocyst complex component EXO70A1-like [Silene latifolia]|uniref:exocyst complex component EXO70A1-like n=1 Tax=Silene latifolia TaxID=37657 RepID=UPI003D771166
MAESDVSKLLAARQCLRKTLEKSKSLAVEIDETGSRLQKINENIPLVSAELKSTYSRKATASAVAQHADQAFGPMSAVLKIYDSVQGIERLLGLGPTKGDIVGYLSLIKQLEGGLKFLSDNCGLAVQWMEDIVKLLDEDVTANNRYVLNLKKSLRILTELKSMEARALVSGGVLSDSFNKLEIEFRRMVKELPANSHELQIIVERLETNNNRFENCKTIYIDVRSSSSSSALNALDLSYLGIEISESDSVQKFEEYVGQWGIHMEFAIKQVLQTEFELCKSVFEKFGSNVSQSCFANITEKSGFLGLLKFGCRITETKKDAIKLLKLLEIFEMLDKLRVDFNVLFGSKECSEIQNLTRDLIKKVVYSACEIFKELSLQVELQRSTMVPSSFDASIPRLVTFVTSYCIMLLDDNYRLILCQILSIHQIWTQNKTHKGVLREELQKIVETMEINLETWAKTLQESSFSYFFLMNNYSYLHELFQQSVIGDFMGEKWLTVYEKKMEIYTEEYLKQSWGKLASILSEKDLVLFSPGRSATQDLVKKRLREFNDKFEEMYKEHFEWIVSDHGLRERACQVIIQAVVPTYRWYLHNYRYLAETGSSPGKYVKYSVTSLEAMLSSLFQPKMTRLRRTNSSRSSQLIGKLRNAVASQFRVAPITT